jgi:hypothetical protein
MPTMPNLRLKRDIIAAVEQQLREHNPSETHDTLDRLLKAGYRRKHAVEVIGSALMQEIQSMLREHRDFDPAHYTSLLRKVR